MKKILLGITCFFACILSIQSQTLYGATRIGGKDGGGTIIKFKPTTNNLAVAKSFENLATSPDYTNLIQADDGKLYGMTSGGGSGYGVIFSYDPSSSTYTRLKDFDGIDGAYPRGSLMQASDGKLYGMTYYGGSSFGIYFHDGPGVIFSFDPSSSTYRKLMDFDGTSGKNPCGSLVQAKDGKLYGVTSKGGGYRYDTPPPDEEGYGVIFSYDPSASTYAKLKDFDPGFDGAYPQGSLMQANDGKLYGMTQSDQWNGPGHIFSFDPSTLTYKDLGSTGGSNPTGTLMQANNGKLYGMTNDGCDAGKGVIFSFDPTSSSYTKLKDFDGTNGGHPQGNLTQARDGKLYGMTNAGGHGGKGVIFSFDPASSTYSKLKDFNGSNGSNPIGSLMQANDGKLYGMARGGNVNAGVIFSFDPASFAYKKLKDFGSNESGSYVTGSVIEAKDGKLYGMTQSGGSSGLGVIFSFDPTSSTFIKLKDFNGTDAANGPSYLYYGSLIQANDGKLYGMTNGGGSSGYAGVIFSFDPSTSTYKKLKDFDVTNGSSPTGSLIQASDKKLYGVTYYGGSSGGGVIFSYDPLSSTYKKLKDFDGINGAHPFGSLIQASDGKLYGITYYGGSGSGVIFSFDPSTLTYTKLKDFRGSDGAYPGGTLMQATDGKLYGMTSAGGRTNQGVIFSFDPPSSIYAKLKDFRGSDGANPRGTLMQATDGKLYGMTSAGGRTNQGVIFSFDPPSSSYTKLKDFNGINELVLMSVQPLLR
ncbi:choice-of-anchor tandem repeat GloVer-containing protein [Segetibacter koreensis]|uniref:choice-of-anchor tandem repeat GloVer-containing protein n=1 Tax=Segetibacter koreensis TaxID=398037 RepID=UPI0003617A07|nr:choice-of-anchor tandem repeat GloVer-containing protein [Segetibacter koreensis]